MENMVKSFFGIRVAKENFSNEDGNTNPLGDSRWWRTSWKIIY
jgi:hypothetical protein